jgi:hypothetical protein
VVVLVVRLTDQLLLVQLAVAALELVAILLVVLELLTQAAAVAVAVLRQVSAMVQVVLVAQV